VLNANEVQMLTSQWQQELCAAKDRQALQELKVRYFGKKGLLSQKYHDMGLLPSAQRHHYGAQLNHLKTEFLTALQTALNTVNVSELTPRKLDIHLPPPKSMLGALHPLTLVIAFIKDFFRARGFLIFEHTPELETTQINFDALNIAPGHPSRDPKDTFYLSNTTLLRTHTSPAQFHLMQRFKPPLAALVPGVVYRRDQDKTHTPMFHQVEGFVINQEVTWIELLDVMHAFIYAFFGHDVQIRLRPSYFPFTEPSLEIDMKKDNCWLEVLGCGMIHPQVLTNMHLDPAVFQGFAFGLGVERLAMLKYGVDDLSIFYKNNLWFLKQFTMPGFVL